MPEIANLLETCEVAAQLGAEELMLWRDRFTAREKSARDLVTDADMASQEAIRKAIRSTFPDHGFLGEESPDPAQLDRPYCWVVDPLDGTTNYVHGFPCYCVSVAVAKEGRVVAGVVFDPLSNRCFKAALGQGSWLDGERISVSGETRLSNALVAVSFPPEVHADSPDIQAFLRVSPVCQAVRRTGSAALNLAYVACGWLDAHWASAIHSWDSAAGILLVAEAGGIVGSFDGGEYNLAQGDYCVASSPELFAQVQELLK